MERVSKRIEVRRQSLFGVSGVEYCLLLGLYRCCLGRFLLLFGNKLVALRSVRVKVRVQ